MPRVQILLDVTVNREVDAPDFTGPDLVRVVTGLLQRAIPKRIPLSLPTRLVTPGPTKTPVVLTIGHAQIGIVGDPNTSPRVTEIPTVDFGRKDAAQPASSEGQAVRVEMQRVERVGGQPSVSLEVA